MPRKTHSPVASFGPELLAALIKGGQEEVRVEFSSHREAFVLRQRLYGLRKALDAENHPLRAEARRATIPNPQEISEGKWVLTIRPVDAGFSSALRNAGVSADSLPKPPPIPPPSFPSDDPSEELPQESSPMGAAWIDNLLKGV